MAEEKKSFSDFLVERGVIAPDQLRKAIQEQKQKGEKLEQTIIRLKYAEEEPVLKSLAEYFNLPYVDLDTYIIDEEITKIIPEEMAIRHTLIPIFKIGNTYNSTL
jgi:type IV pilus assembly protein PilB